MAKKKPKAPKKSRSAKSSRSSKAAPKGLPEGMEGLPDRRALEVLMRQALSDVLGEDDPSESDTPQGMAEAMVSAAFMTEDPEERLALARQALEAFPDCADAQVLLAESCNTPKQAIRYYEQAVASAERVLGPERFKHDIGQFWLIWETRPYMRARAGLADALMAVGRREEAADHLRDLLRLNPNDNQGLRFELAACLLDLGRDQDVTDLLDRHEDDKFLACSAFTRALLAFRKEGASDRARGLLNVAKKQNKHVIPVLIGDKPLPAEIANFMSLGDTNEAFDYCYRHLRHWRETPGAIAWLRELGTKPRRKSARTNSPQGPLPIVKERLRRLPLKHTVKWQAAVVRLPTWAFETGRMVRPWLVVVLSRAEGLILAGNVAGDPPEPYVLWDALAQAMEEPMAGKPHRPGILLVRANNAWPELAPHFEEIGITLQVSDELHPLDDLIAEMVAEIQAEDTFPGLLAIPGILPEQAAAFFDAAAEYYEAAPWRKISGDEAIRVELKVRKAAKRFAVVMGQVGMAFGLALYDDVESLNGALDPAQTDEQRAMCSRAMSVTFDDEFEIPVADYDAAQEYGWRVAGPDAYPTLMRIDTGMKLRQPTIGELEELEACLRAIPEFLDRHDVSDGTPETLRVRVASGEREVRLSWVQEP